MQDHVRGRDITTTRVEDCANACGVDRYAARFGISLLWPVMIVGALLYGSCLPFTFDWSRIEPANIVPSLLAGSRVFRLDDVITNLLIYLPFGASVALWLSRRHECKTAVVFGSCILAAGLSLAVESVQIAIPGRLSSLLDVALNVGGALVGATAAIALTVFGASWLHRARRHFAAAPFQSVAAALTLALFLIELAPFSFVTDTAQLHESFRRAWGALRNPRYDAPFLTFLAGQLTDLIWFAVLGYLLALAGRERGKRRERAFVSAVKNALVLASVIEFVQVLTRLHVAEIYAIPWRVCGALFGAWAALYLLDASGVPWRRRPVLAAPTILLLILLAVQLSVIALTTVGAVSDGAISGVAPTRLPFQSAWRMPFDLVIAGAVESAVLFGALAATLGVALRRGGVAGAWPATAWLVVMLAGVTELVEGYAANTGADMVVPLAAGLSVMAIARACQWQPWVGSEALPDPEYAG